MEKSCKTVAPYRLLLLARSPRYRHSLAALLATMPGVEILEYTLGGKAFESIGTAVPDMLLVAGGLPSTEPARLAGADLIRKARALWPGLKVVLLVEPAQFVPGAHLGGVDLVLPVDTTAGELLQSINRLAGSEGSRPKTPALVLSA